jgi:hypothetical protein
VATAPAPVTTRGGLVLLPDADTARGRVLPPIGADPPAHALDATLGDIAGRYGEPTAAFVALQLEYPR